ncbi:MULTISPECIES: pyridoxamine kinase [unclassified Halanaerobium]|uniref:pyridoxamine kinase n=1 Tax=unclassified Halanaerobium TaxID=2641197 RepID=UPI000DF25D29|nr:MULTISPECIES: pyridoxamine kinase [unclassified Halanaerobium]RCW40914.1 pyridoxine kinase [Halanaerobium sp. MA284_MarDTE_T2]RCW79226.1 pyridoxine kinase [Halanaerobium sp. DL-01]
MKNPVKKVAAIHDMSGFGRSSLTVIIPILSTMGIQVCPVPTSILSTHTGGFTDYKFIDLTEHLEEYIAHWKKLDLNFNSIYSGFLGSVKQIDIVADFINFFGKDSEFVVVDPVMGDDGKKYATYTDDMVKKMKELVSHADIITPNMTEAAFLLNEEYPLKMDKKLIKNHLYRLADMGPEIVIITSMPYNISAKKTSVIAYNNYDERFWRVDCDYIPTFYPGTGDIFASVLVGSMLQGDSLPLALSRSVQFTSTAIKTTYGYDYDNRDGVMLERVLENLKAPVINHSYELF